MPFRPASVFPVICITALALFVILATMFAPSLHATEIGPPIDTRDANPLSYFSLGVFGDRISVKGGGDLDGSRGWVERMQGYGSAGMKFDDGSMGFLRVGFSDFNVFDHDFEDEWFSAGATPFIGVGYRRTFFQKDTFALGCMADAEYFANSTNNTRNDTSESKNKFLDIWQARVGVTAKRTIFGQDDRGPRLSLYGSGYLVRFRARSLMTDTITYGGTTYSFTSSGVLTQDSPVGAALGARFVYGGFEWFSVDAEVQYQGMTSFGLVFTRAF